MVAPEALADVLTQPPALCGAIAMLVKLTCRIMLSAEVPMHVHRAQARLKIRGRDWGTMRVHPTHITCGDVSTSLLQGLHHPVLQGAVNVVEVPVSGRKAIIRLF